MIRTGFMERYGKLEEMDRSFDLAFWQAQHPEARFHAAWELIIHACKVKGIDVVNSDFSDRLRIFNDHNIILSKGIN